MASSPEIVVVNKINKKVSELTVDDIALYCEQSGITISSLCLKLNGLLNATREIKDRDGDLLDTVPDNNVQLKALVVSLELLKLVNKKDTNINIGINEKQIGLEEAKEIEDIFKRVEDLRKRRDMDRIQQGATDAECIPDV